MNRLVLKLPPLFIFPAIGPSRSANRKINRDCDFALYRERNLIGRFFNKD